MKEKFIADRITELRLKRDISEYSLSYELGKSKSYIGSITSGEALPSVPMFLAICDYFDLSPAEFFAPSFDREAQKMTELFQKLNEDHKKFVTDMMTVMIKMQEEDS